MLEHTSFEEGPWKITSTERKRPSKDGKNGRPEIHIVVLVRYNGKVVIRGQGRVALGNAEEMVRHWIATGYTPKSCGKCMAELSPSDRLKCATRCEHPEFFDPGSLEREMEFKPWSLPSE